MSQSFIVNGVTYPYPDVGEQNWGQDLIDWSNAITNGLLQKSGGSFTLTAEVDFGAAFGLKSLYYKSRTSNVASAGQVRLARADVVSWRNQANGANLDLAVDSSDLISFGGSKLFTQAGGSFTLAAEADFGGSFGLKTLYYKSQTANPASAGQIRFARADVLAWRNQANDGDLSLGVNSSNVLTWPSGVLVDTDTFSIDATNNRVGIGIAAPAKKLDVLSAVGDGVKVSDGTASGIFGPSSTYTNSITLGSTSNHNLVFGTNNTFPQFTILAGGEMLFGNITDADIIVNKTPGASLSTAGLFRAYRTLGNPLQLGHATSGAVYAAFFYDGGTLIGSIAAVGTTGVVYNTTSDKRLKDNIQPISNSGEIIDALNPVKFDWKYNPSEGSYGFLAQELLALIPGAGTKGDDKENGKPGDTDFKSWGIDFSKIVPFLVAEVKSLRARVQTLEA